MSQRKADRKFRQWVKYFRKYEPWHFATPGMEKAYNQCVHASCANMRKTEEK